MIYILSEIFKISYKIFDFFCFAPFPVGTAKKIDIWYGIKKCFMLKKLCKKILKVLQA